MVSRTKAGCISPAKEHSLHPELLSSLVKRYVEAANTGQTGACHLFRHTMATLMLEGGPT